MTTELALAGPGDTEAVVRLLTAQLVEHRLPADEAGIRRGVALAFSAGSAAWIVLARRAGHPAGIALANRIVSVERGGEVLWLEELYIEPAARRVGVASAILSYLETRATGMGMRGIELEVVPTQAAALALYEHHGFDRLNRLRVSKQFGPPAP
jgi:GNAT superfamily N-acetyltransferase